MARVPNLAPMAGVNWAYQVVEKRLLSLIKSLFYSSLFKGGAMAVVSGRYFACAVRNER